MPKAYTMYVKGHGVFILYTCVWYDFFHSQMEVQYVCVWVGGIFYVQGNLE